MLDFKLFDTLEGQQTVRDAFEKRSFDGKGLLDIAIAAREEAHKANVALYDAREKKNALSKEFGLRKKNRQPTDDLAAEIEKVNLSIPLIEEIVSANESALHNAVAMMPNIPGDVPVGDETANVIIEPGPYPTDAGLNLPSPPLPQFNFKPKHHLDIGTKMQGIEMERAGAMSGTRFAVLSGALAKLERVLGQWMLDHAIEHGYQELSVPHLVKANAMFGTGQLPKFEADLFKAGDHYLIPTAEVPLTNMVAGRILEITNSEASWTTRMCALTPCYRAEAGSAGRDTRGLLRMHQFNKVELVTICHPAESEDEHIRMLGVARNVLLELELPCRTVLLSTGDMGFSSRKTYDLEVWIPSENQYREIASISNCGDFQARRMNARWKWRGEKGTKFCHTLNGSGVAVGRALLAIIENNQTEQGGVAIPKVLRERMGGSLITDTGAIV